MGKKIFIILSMVVSFLGITKFSFAMMCGDHSGNQQMAQAHAEHEPGITKTSKAAVSTETVNVGNKICPVSGEKIDEKLKETSEYQGKIYNFCCAMCIDAFKKDPEKYIKKIEDELLAEAKQESGLQKQEIVVKQDSGAAEQGHQH